MDDTPEEPLEERLSDLEAELRAVRMELRQSTRRGPFGFPRPPSPSEVFRFADQAAIPATIAILEANIKLLEALQKAIRLLEPPQKEADRDESSGTDRALALGSRSLDRFEQALTELERAINRTPDDVAGEEILTEARQLQTELADRIDAARAPNPTDAEADSRRSVQAGSDDEQAETDPEPIDVDQELESIKEEHREENPEDGNRDEDSEDGGDTPPASAE